MKTLLLQLIGMQAWGTSRFDLRDTNADPSKSGVIGLEAAAFGYSRDETTWIRPSLEDLTRMTMCVRVDREGQLFHDFHTVNGIIRNDGGSGGSIISDRYYLADAAFIVALGGEDWLVDALAKAIADPVYPLFLGRRCCPPCAPVFLGVSDLEPQDALKSLPVKRRDYEMRNHPKDKPWQVRLVSEDLFGAIRYDVPLSLKRREHSPRRIISRFWTVPSELVVRDNL